MTPTIRCPSPIPEGGTEKRTEDLTFHASPEPTVGVELELQILDRDSNDLAPGAVPILKACAQDDVPNVSAELMQSMIEVRTGVCRDVAEARSQLVPVLQQLSNIARSLGYDLSLGGTHPFHRTMASVVFPAERYERILDRLGWLTYQRVVFGLHVHVGVPSGDRAIRVINQVVPYLPHLLALSANSPFWNGIDTGLASSRAALYALLPHSGIPRYFGTWKEFRAYCQVMRDCGTIQSFKDIYWDVRPRPDFGTIEFRICDMPASLGLALSLVALTRCLVIHCLRLLQEKPHSRRADIRRNWIAGENKWLATRYGLAGAYIRSPAGKRRQLGLEVADLIHRLMPLAEETGDAPFLAALVQRSTFESGATCQRQHYRAVGDWKLVLDEMKLRFSRELQSLALANAIA